MFDREGNLWMVCDITTASHNKPVQRETEATLAGQKEFVGVFGNNAMFMIPTSGPKAGVPFCFAIGPMECELTGPTFTEDGRTLILSVQHPGELYGTRLNGTFDEDEKKPREMRIADRQGFAFTQSRKVPMGSNFPMGKPGDVPRPCVVAIRRG